jgi:uncharacterized protein YbaP (TraB family)
MRFPNGIRRAIGASTFLIASLLGPVGAQEERTVQPTENPLLWRIETTPPSYLFGTIHLPDERVTTLHPAVDRALDEVDAFFAELPLDQAFGPGMLRRLALPDRKTLDEVLPEDVYGAVERAFQKAGIPFSMMRRLKIWTVAVQLQLIDHLQSFASGKALDQLLYDRAKDDLLDVAGIEDVEEQLEVFDGLDQEQQVEMLRKALHAREEARLEKRDPLEELIELYLEGDVEKLATQGMDEMDGELGEKLADRLIHARNRRMAERIHAHLEDKADEPAFFAVGAAHFGGPTGILAHLRSRGHRITRLPETAAHVEARILDLETELQRLRRRLEDIRTNGSGTQKSAAGG